MTGGRAIIGVKAHFAVLITYSVQIMTCCGYPEDQDSVPEPSLTSQPASVV